MADKTFAAVEYTYAMSEAELLKLRNQALLLRRHHIRALRQLQLFAQRGIPASHPLYVRAHKRLRHLEKRLEAIHHKVAHAQLSDAFAEDQPAGGVWSVLLQWARDLWARTRQKQRHA